MNNLFQVNLYVWKFAGKKTGVIVWPAKTVDLDGTSIKYLKKTPAIIVHLLTRACISFFFNFEQIVLKKI